MTPATTTRRTGAERREEILEAALTEFAARGFDGASTEAIARRAGLSQPYLFRLFGTKKELFLASVRRCFDDTHERFAAASAGLKGEEALHAMGRSYTEMISNDPRRLLAQLQAYSACDDPDVRDAVRAGYGRLVEHVESLGIPPQEVNGFFARGMLVNVLAAMGLPSGDVPWGDRLLSACRSHD